MRLRDPRIQGILLDVDSPGGEVGGLFDLADEIYDARAEKPCFAIADDDAFSAAYAIASRARNACSSPAPAAWAASA